MSSAGPVFNTTTHAGGNAQINNVTGNFYVLSEEKADKIWKWLDAPDSSGNYQAAREKHHEKTGTWFIEGEEYVKWKETPDSALWVYGTPGCGKTIICSTVIENIRRKCAADPSSACAYFFFDGRNAQTDLSLHNRLIRSIIKQLSHQSSGIPAPLVELYEDGQEQPSIASLQLTLQKIIDGFERAYIIIDAVDECIDREKVLGWLEQLIQCKAGNLHVLFSSRPEHDIKDRLQAMVPLARITLNGRLAEKDIETYIDAMLSMMIRWDAETIARVRDALVIRSDGMFRWVALQISELFKCRTRRAVDDQLRDLPRDLGGMYEKYLLDSPHREDLKRFLMWLAFSSRPLNREELADVVTVDLSSNGLPLYNPDLQYFGPADMLLTCSSFVIEIEEQQTALYGNNRLNKIMKLAHMSIKDYLVSDQLKSGPASYFSINAMLAHSLLTKTCLGYLFHLRSLRAINSSVLESFPLGKYAAAYWMIHMRLGGGEDEHLSEMMHCIFSLEEGAFINWVRLADNDGGSSITTRPGIRKDEAPSAKIAPPLYYACKNGLKRVAKQLLIDGVAVNGKGGHYGTALQAALRYRSYGHEHYRSMYTLQVASCHDDDALVRLLLEYGADVNAPGHHGNPLHAALQAGDITMVRLLLEHGADANAEGSELTTALQVASKAGHNAIVQLLLVHGADVNTQAVGKSALHVASAGGHYVIVQLLLEQGADTNAHTFSNNALQSASEIGHDGIVRLLLEQGAEVNAPASMFGGTALQSASRRGHDDIVCLLLKRGADVNAPGGLYGTALYAASHGGHDVIVRLLIEQGADVNVKRNAHGTGIALHAASRWGHDAIVRLLLKHGADVNAQEDDNRTALHAASEAGHHAIVRLLLERGADVNAVEKNALHAASNAGHDGIVQLLLEWGADVNAQGGQFGSALLAALYGGHDVIIRFLLEQGADVNVSRRTLQFASGKGDDVIVRLLLENGADVNAQDLPYCETALQAVISNMGNGTAICVDDAIQVAEDPGRDVILRLLIEHGADVNAPGPLAGGTALQLAAGRGKDDIVQLLLENGADVNLQGETYGTALQAASEGGHNNIARLLLQQGADVNAQGESQGESRGGALQAASLEGHDDIVRLLLEHGADVNTQGGHYGNALHAASYRGHDTIVQLLLAKGAEVNAQGGHYIHALQAASQEGYDDIVRLLLEHGADVNAPGPRGNALQAASWKGAEAIVRLLLEHGADVDARGRDFTALQAASSRGHDVIVRLLLEHGGDVNVEGVLSGNNALQAAIEAEHNSIGECNGFGDFGQCNAIVRLLLENGADVNAKGSWSRSVLQVARSYGLELTVQLLLEHGAIDENSEEEKGEKGGDGEWDIAERGDEVEGSVGAEGDECSTDDNSEEEWASAEEHLDESTED